MPIIRKKDHVLLHMECICWYCWMWQVAVLWCYVEGVITVKVAASTIIPRKLKVLTVCSKVATPKTLKTSRIRKINSTTLSAHVRSILNHVHSI